MVSLEDEVMTMENANDRRKVLTPALYVELVTRYTVNGKRVRSDSLIADDFGVSRARVSQVRELAKEQFPGVLPETPTEATNRTWPWGNIPGEFQRTQIYQNLRAFARYIATGGKGMSAVSVGRVLSLLALLRDGNLVVEFDPKIPPEPGVSNKGGWRYVPRNEELDGDAQTGLIFRVNEHTRELTDEIRLIWKFPATLP
ncbi:hypothetical protein [Kutzneria chonburiensis]|uniref:Uncharacterized protein n=1 Tax=Kutzneria chonburiensis TaxID=1483604 RepID=A0ABV6N3N3_9PSEU|nr:hypothetical protein [Kutzneria chonburiensis]